MFYKYKFAYTVVRSNLNASNSNLQIRTEFNSYLATFPQVMSLSKEHRFWPNSTFCIFIGKRVAKPSRSTKQTKSK